MVINRTTRSDDTTLEICHPSEAFSPLLILERDADGRTRDKIVLDHEEIALLGRTILGESVDENVHGSECANCEGVLATDTVRGTDLCPMCAAAAKRGSEVVLQ